MFVVTQRYLVKDELFESFLVLFTRMQPVESVRNIHKKGYELSIYYFIKWKSSLLVYYIFATEPIFK